MQAGFYHVSLKLTRAGCIYRAKASRMNAALPQRNLLRTDFLLLVRTGFVSRQSRRPPKVDVEPDSGTSVRVSKRIY